MPNGWAILKVVGKALVLRGGKFLLNAVSGGVLGEAVEVVQYAWEEWQKETGTEEARQASLQALAQAPIQEVRSHAAEVVQEVAADQPEAVRQNLVNYLTHVPATVRRSLRRASDPSGTTIPAGLVLRKADDLLALLPPRLPRFKEGDFPIANVDLELVELLGVGGFGEVWKARNPYQQNDPPVALKFCIDADAASSLRHEAALLDRVKSQGTHPGIVRLLRTYLRADPPCLEYEYVAGGDLGGVIQELHRTAGGVRPDKAAKLMLRLAEVVGFAHRLDPPIVHRDLKPANVLVQKKDKGIVLKVADFGIGGVAVGKAVAESRGDSTKALLAATVARGSYTALYASPQQMAGLPADPRDDVYALGVIWHQLLTGDLSKGRPGGSRWKERLTEKGLPATMVRLLEDCFEDDPEDRPKDAADLAVRLSGLLTPAPATIAAPVPKKEPSPPPKLPVVPPATRTAEQSGEIKEVRQAVRNLLEQHQLQERQRNAPLEQDAPPTVAAPKNEQSTGLLPLSESREKAKGSVEAKEVLKLEEQGAEEGFGHFGRFATAAFSPDGKFILSACMSVRLWNFPAGTEVCQWKLPPQTATCMAQPVTCLAFSPDGRHALTGGSDGLLRLWDVRSGQEIRSFGGGWFKKKGRVNSVAFSPDGRLALIGGDEPFMQLWDLTGDKEVRRFKVGTWALRNIPGASGCEKGTTSVAFTADGSQALSGHTLKTMTLHGPRCVFFSWNVDSGQEAHQFSGHNELVHCVAVSSDSRYVLSGSSDHTVRLWELATGKEVRTFKGHAAPVHAVAFSPDGRLAVSGNGLFAGKTPEQRPPESIVRVWRVESGEEVCQLAGHTGQVRSVSFSSDGQFVLSAGSDKTIRVWAIQGV